MSRTTILRFLEGRQPIKNVLESLTIKEGFLTKVLHPGSVVIATMGGGKNDLLKCWDGEKSKTELLIKNYQLFLEKYFPYVTLNVGTKNGKPYAEVLLNVKKSEGQTPEDVWEELEPHFRKLQVAVTKDATEYRKKKKNSQDNYDNDDPEYAGDTGYDFD